MNGFVQFDEFIGASMFVTGKNRAGDKSECRNPKSENGRLGVRGGALS